MGRQAILASCSLAQWALDLEGNLVRIKQSIHEAKAKGATLRTGPELEICGYGCHDHFFESDLLANCWEMMLDLLTDESCRDILLDIGMPVQHRGFRYICRVTAYNGKLILIRPKTWMKNIGNYQESRWFTPWGPTSHVEEYCLPQCIAAVQGSEKVPIGDALISTQDLCLRTLTCDETLMFKTPTHSAMCVGDIDIFTASAAEHFELGGYDSLISSLQEKSEERKGTILYSNQHGCDGDRLYYDGGATSISNGEVIAQGPRFSLHDVDVIIATVNIDRGWTYRPKRHHQQQQRSEGKFLYPRVEVACNLTRKVQNSFRSAPRYVPSKCERSLPVEGEIGVGPACYLWHYLRRSGCSGFLVPLSGGIDSCSTALVVYTMCTFAFNLLRTDKQVALDIQRITGIKDWLPKSPQEFSNRILHTVYMSVSQCSTPETQSRAQRLAEQLNAHHLSMSIDSVYQAARDLLPQHTGYTPHFRGSLADDVALQNLQARSRSTTAYYFAHTLPTARHQPSTSPTPAPTCGGLVVLSSVNVEECRRGNQTKHDCSSADLSPISSLSETQVRKFVKWSRHHYSLPILDAFLDATPRAELRPSCFAPRDEKETGMTHDQLFTLARLRSQERLGPLAMFEALVVEWQGQLGARETAELVKRFWISYANNRHKMSAVTPAVHAAFCGAGDGLDRRPILYPQFEGTRVFKQIEKRVLELERSSREAGGNAVDECGNAIAVAV